MKKSELRDLVTEFGTALAEECLLRQEAEEAADWLLEALLKVLAQYGCQSALQLVD